VKQNILLHVYHKKHILHGRKFDGNIQNKMLFTINSCRKITFQNHLDYLFSTDISLKKNTHKNQYISCFLIFTDSEYLEKLYLQCEGTKALERFYLYYQECVKVTFLLWIHFLIFSLI
jgi:hypothetical protein